MSESRGALMGFEALRSAGAPYPAHAAVNGSEWALQEPIRPCAGGCGTVIHAGRGRIYCSDRCRLLAWAKRQEGAAKQRALPGQSRVERAFRDWIDTAPGRYVEAEVARLAREDKAAGDRRGEINLYLALVRRASRGLTKDREGYACNNSYRSLLARRLMARHPELAGYFRTRELRGRP